MNLLIIGTVVFFLIHLLPSFVSKRQSLINSYGEPAYKGVFSLLAAIGLGLIVVGKIKADFIGLWVLPGWTRYLTISFLLISFILLPAAYLPNNIKRFTPHPMLWAVVLWSVGHLMANGDLASLILFAGFIVFALFNIKSANIRGVTEQAFRLPIRNDLMVIVAGVLAFAVVFFLHPVLFGVHII